LFSKSNAINKQATNGQKDDQRPSKYVQFLCMHNCQFDTLIRQVAALRHVKK